MIETRRLKTVFIFLQTILSFVLSRKIIHRYKIIYKVFDKKRCKLNLHVVLYCKATFAYIIKTLVQAFSPFLVKIKPG